MILCIVICPATRASLLVLNNLLVNFLNNKFCVFSTLFPDRHTYQKKHNKTPFKKEILKNTQLFCQNEQVPEPFEKKKPALRYGVPKILLIQPIYLPFQNKPAPQFCLQNPEFLAHHTVLFRDSYFLNGSEVLKISE